MHSKQSNFSESEAGSSACPDFLREHVTREWGDVALSCLNPDICLQVDAGLAYCGCEAPSPRLRQYVYAYHQSDDFDYQTLAQLIRIFSIAGDGCPVWEDLVQLELERDCGLSRPDYLARLLAVADHLESMADQPLPWPRVELSA